MDATDRLPDIGDIAAAARRLEGVAIRTPLLESERLNERAGARVFLKCEMFQPVGAFKIRGAWNIISQIPAGSVGNGVVAFSSGNHAQAVAWAARRMGTSATIVMPSDAPAVKVDNTKALGADVVLYDRASGDREAIAADISDRTGATIVPPFDHPAIIAGQGTVGLELMQQLEEAGAATDAVIVPCSGGGLVSGCAIAVKDRAPEVSVLAAEPANFDDTARSLAAGVRISNPPGHASICDALLVPTPGEMTFDIMRRTLAGGVVVTDDEVRDAVRAAFLDARVVVEPGGAAGLAAVLSGRLPQPVETVCVVLSGGNVDRDLFREILNVKS